MPARTPLQARITAGLTAIFTMSRTCFPEHAWAVCNRKSVRPSKPHAGYHGAIPVRACARARRRQSPLPASRHLAGAAWLRGVLIDTIEFGEVPGIHHGLHDLGMWDWLSLGYTPAGPEVWNAIRALDYLERRPEVDPSSWL